jgi:hypothetical protein
MLPGAISTTDLLELIDCAEGAELNGLRPPDLGDDVLFADPVMGALSELTARLRTATRQIALAGWEAIDEGVKLITECWQTYRAQLGERASELSDAFRHQVATMIQGVLEKLARLAPAKIERATPMNISSISFKLSLALSPSVVGSATEWFRLVATGGIEMSLTYSEAILSK